jgi:hypothetical protein
MVVSRQLLGVLLCTIVLSVCGRSSPRLPCNGLIHGKDVSVNRRVHSHHSYNPSTKNMHSARTLLLSKSVMIRGGTTSEKVASILSGNLPKAKLMMQVSFAFMLYNLTHIPTYPLPCPGFLVNFQHTVLGGSSSESIEFYGQ